MENVKQLEFIEDTAEVVDAEVIEDVQPESELRIVHAEPGSAIEGNFAALRLYIDKMVGGFEQRPITSEEQWKSAKGDRASVRRIISDIEAERKRIKRLYTAPLDAFEAEVKQVLEPAREADAAIKGAMDMWESQRKGKRMDELERRYIEFAPALVPLVPFGRICEDAWVGRSMSEDKAISEMEQRVGQLARDYESIRSQHLKHEDDAVARWAETLDVGAALARDRELTEREEAARRLRELQEQPPVAQPEPPSRTQAAEPAPEAATSNEEPEAAPEMVTGLVIAYQPMTRAQLDGLMAYCKQAGIHGTRRIERSGR